MTFTDVHSMRNLEVFTLLEKLSFQKILRNLFLFLWMVINLSMFREIYICELSQTTTLCDKYFCKSLVNLFKRFSLKYMFQLRRTNCVWIGVSYFILLPYSKISTNLKGYVPQVSLVNRARSGSIEYFDLTFETQEEIARVLCFSLEKWERIKQIPKGRSNLHYSQCYKNRQEFKLTNN